MLISWPKKYQGNVSNHELVCLTDMFGYATALAGCEDVRDGISLSGMLDNTAAPRNTLFACYGKPGTPLYKAMVRCGDWKYIFMSNGGYEQLFNITEDPNEHVLMNDKHPDVISGLRDDLKEWMKRPGLAAGLDNDGSLKIFEYTERERYRFIMFDASNGVKDFTRLQK